MLGAVLLAALTESAGYAGVSIVISVPPPVVVAAPPVVIVQDDYAYYPNYVIYYNRHRHQYAFLDGGVWVFAPTPMGVSVEVLLASPSVHMEFHDSPEHHHAAMLQKYPRNWKPTGEHHDQKDAGPDHDKK